MANQSVTIKVNMATLDKMQSFYQDGLFSNPGEYVLFSAKALGAIITAYKGKDLNSFKVLFVGDDALSEAKIWDSQAKINIAKKTVASHWLELGEQIGSDEVGTGDFFGPIVVVATHISEKDVNELKKLGVDDSKKLTDEFIMDIGPKAIKKYHYSLLTVSDEKYNELVKQGYNMNSIKAMLHNTALLNMQAKYGKKCPVFIDQFCEPSIFYRYLRNQPKTIQGVTFRTKGESYFPSVALASVIARYSFLVKMKDLGGLHHVELPFGASTNVDRFADQLYQKIGQEEFDKLVKANFKNYSRIIETDNTKK